MMLSELRRHLLSELKDTDFLDKTYFAGGCVRDELLGRQVAHLDADLVVELPQGGIKLARFLEQHLCLKDIRLHPTFGTASASWNDVQLDFAMTRSEIYNPGSRHPRVKFAPLKFDFQRRDFTINALYKNLRDGEVSDPSGWGLIDLNQRIIRCLKNPISSFQEDPLRMLRALRFAVVLDLVIEPETWNALCDNASLLQSLSSNRCQSEIAKLTHSGVSGSDPRWQNLLHSSGLDIHLAHTLPKF